MLDILHRSGVEEAVAQQVAKAIELRLHELRAAEAYNAAKCHAISRLPPGVGRLTNAVAVLLMLGDLAGARTSPVRMLWAETLGDGFQGCDGDALWNATASAVARLFSEVGDEHPVIEAASQGYMWVLGVPIAPETIYQFLGGWAIPLAREGLRRTNRKRTSFPGFPVDFAGYESDWAELVVRFNGYARGDLRKTGKRW